MVDVRFIKNSFWFVRKLLIYLCALFVNSFRLAKASLRTSTGFYFTLIILTNGSIKNTQDTVDTIVQASELPMSIVFVALGNSENPIGHSGGDASKLLHLLSPSLKSSKNVALKRETVSLVVNNQGSCFCFLLVKAN